MKEPFPRRGTRPAPLSRSGLLWSLFLLTAAGAALLATGAAAQAPGASARGAPTSGRADFDGDGKTDVLGVGALDEQGRYTGAGSLFYSTGASRLQDEVGWAAGAREWAGYGFQIGDFDGDRKSDVLGVGALDETGRYTGTGGLFYRSGASRLRGEVVWSAGSPAWRGTQFQTGDFDGDGKTDVLAPGTLDESGKSTGTGCLVLWTRGLKERQTVACDVPAWRNYRFEVGDVDGDGRDDLLGIGAVDEYGRYTGTGRLFYRTGASGLRREVEWAAGARGWAKHRFQLGDFDGDGKDDLLGVGPVDEAGRYLGQGPLFYRTGASGLRRGVTWGGGAPAWSDYLLFAGRVTRPAARPIAPSFLTPALIDLNGDGRLEPFGFLNSGRGLVPQDLRVMGITQLREGGRTPRDNRVADFNGDGLLDVLSNTYDCQNFGAQVAQLYLGRKDGTFSLDPQFSKLGLRGRGETIVTADFDNDGDLDVFLPYYADEIGGRSDGTGAEVVVCDGRVSNAKHNPLLINDGRGRFRDVGLQTPMGRQRGEERPEGAQALDFNFDGWIDLYVSGRIFLNTGGAKFKERSAEYRLPYLFEEGAKFLDWNNDGHFDLIQMHPENGPRLLEFNGKVFRDITASTLPRERYEHANGMNIYDMNGDGREDLLVMGGLNNQSGVLLNQGGRFVRSDFLRGLGNGRSGMGLGDIDGDGRVDVLYSGRELRYFRNTLPAGPVPPMTVEVLGPGGELNQHGRVIRVRPTLHQDVRFTRAVDSGSGYMAQNQYPVLIGTPYSGAHTAEVIFAPLPGKTAPSVVRFTLQPGQRAQVFAPSPARLQGRVKISRTAFR